MDTFESLASTIPADISIPAPPLPATDTDLSSLDNLMEESTQLAKPYAPNRRVYKELKKDVDSLKRKDEFATWEVLEYISVWTQTICQCGEPGPMAFCRYMRKLRQVSKHRRIHWEEVEELQEMVGVGTRNALVVRDIQACEHCVDLAGMKFEDFTEVVK